MAPPKPKFKTGMYLFETLTAGMYNDPLSIYREYIQNSVDSIDLTGDSIAKFRVEINLDPIKKRIVISDNGGGISSDLAQEVLCSLGDSNKINQNLRGFRGIGRLGGIAFSDVAAFQTKADGETIESIQEWDCKALRDQLGSTQKKEITLAQIVEKISNFRQIKGKKARGSYFKVSLDGVKSFRNYIFDIKKIKNYLSQTAPAPYNPKEFSFASEIHTWLSSKVPSYRAYDIFLNGSQVHKRYKDFVKITKSGYDSINDFQKIEISVKDEIVAYGWLGVRRDLLGAIAKGDGTSGIHVRVGNILIGDSHLLDGCFRENRFNSYLIGEIHICSPKLIPNSRRDDFIDNEYKTLFYNAVEREIGFNLSKEIRLRSRANAFNREKLKFNNQTENNFKKVAFPAETISNIVAQLNETISIIQESVIDHQKKISVLGKLEDLKKAISLPEN